MAIYNLSFFTLELLVLICLIVVDCSVWDSFSLTAAVSKLLGSLFISAVFDCDWLIFDLCYAFLFQPTERDTRGIYIS